MKTSGKVGIAIAVMIVVAVGMVMGVNVANTDKTQEEDTKVPPYVEEVDKSEKAKISFLKDYEPGGRLTISLSKELLIVVEQNFSSAVDENGELELGSSATYTRNLPVDILERIWLILHKYSAHFRLDESVEYEFYFSNEDEEVMNKFVTTEQTEPLERLVWVLQKFAKNEMTEAELNEQVGEILTEEVVKL